MSALPLAHAPGQWRVAATRRIEYELRKADDVFDPQNDALLAGGRSRGSRRFVVIDDQVHRLHGARVAAYFQSRGVQARILALPGGEEHKDEAAWRRVLQALDAFPIHRRDEPVIAIGGGVLTDVVGFAASCYRRGLPHIKVPTTLMGYVDAAVGIKTGINFNGHKNRLGSFEPPRRVLLDRRLLATLAPRHLRNGVCEIVKLAVICDAGLFDLLERSGADALASAFQAGASAAILDRAVGGMLRELAPNLYEDDLARAVDFGHTFSYGLEMRHAATLLHGEAVLLDVLASTVIAERRGLLAEADGERVLALVARLGLQPEPRLLEPAHMWQALLDRIEHRNGHQHVPLPTAIGACAFADDVVFPEIEAAVAALTERMTGHEPIAQC
ncbi:MAG: iron-containing alcohol dehydrogenase [Burkholderiaceae bacterium]|nr:MAG: iron-containing alcohol dehydrogenase [Burkholderiaceae bacterium]